MNAQTWTVAQAKAKFSEVIDRAMSEGPQTVTRKGRTAVVVVDAEEWNRKTQASWHAGGFLCGLSVAGVRFEAAASKRTVAKD